MKSYLGVFVFLALVNIAFGAVSESSVSEGSSSDNAAQVYTAGMSPQDGSSFVSGYQGPQNYVPDNLPYQQGIYAYSGYGAAAGAYPNSYATSQQVSLPPGAPTPPNPNAENLILPDYNQYAPVAAQAIQGSVPAMGGPQGYAVSGSLPMQSNYPAQGGYSANGCEACSHQGSYQGANPSQTCTSCTGQAPAFGANSMQGNCATCTGKSSMAAPAGYPVQNCQAVFPKPSPADAMNTMCSFARASWARRQVRTADNGCLSGPRSAGLELTGLSSGRYAEIRRDLSAHRRSGISDLRDQAGVRPGFGATSPDGIF